MSSVQSLSHVRPFGTHGLQHTRLPCPFRSLLKLMFIKSVMPSNPLILCHPLRHLPSVFLSIRVFSSESVLRIRWPKYWSFNFSLSPFDEYSGLFSFRIDWLISSQSKGLSTLFSNTTVQKHQFFTAQVSLWFNSHIHTMENHSFDYMDICQ